MVLSADFAFPAALVALPHVAHELANDGQIVAEARMEFYLGGHRHFRELVFRIGDQNIAGLDFAFDG